MSEMEKMLVSRIFSCSQNVSYHSKNKSRFLSSTCLLSAFAFSLERDNINPDLDQSKHLLLGKELHLTVPEFGKIIFFSVILVVLFVLLFCFLYPHFSEVRGTKPRKLKCRWEHGLATANKKGYAVFILEFEISGGSARTL